MIDLIKFFDDYIEKNLVCFYGFKNIVMCIGYWNVIGYKLVGEIIVKKLC